MKRKIIAVALNLLLFPFGYYYLKQPRRFFLMALVSIFFLVLGRGILFWAHLLGGGTGAFAAFAALVLTFFVIVTADTVLVARRQPTENRFFHMPHALWVVPFAFAMIIVVREPLHFFSERYVSAHWIASSSMEPTLLAGDMVYVRKILKPEEKTRGKLVVWHVRGEKGEMMWLKRIVGIPGDKLELRELNTARGRILHILVNGENILDEQSSEPFLRRDDEPFFLYTEGFSQKQYRIQESYEGAGPFVGHSFLLGPDQFFLIGDNRDDSKDSRYLGPVSADSITHEYMFHYFSVDFKDDLCWNRKLDQALCLDIHEFRRDEKGLLSKLRRYQMRWNRIGLVVK